MLIVVLLVAYCFLSYFKPKYALWSILALLPTYQIRFQIFNIPLTFLEVMILILFVVYFGRNISGLRNIKEQLGSWQWLILVWLIIATVSMFIAPDLKAAAGVWKAYFVEPILFLIIFISLIKSKEDLKSACIALIFSAFYISVWAIGQKFSLLHSLGFGGQVGSGVWSLEVWGQPKIWRATGPFSHPNFLGLYLGPLILLGLGRIFSSFRKKQLIIISSLIFFVLTFGALIFARSEGAAVGVLASLIFLGLILKSSRRWVIGFLILVLLTLVFWPGPRDYLIQKAGFQDLSGQLRLNIWQGANSLIKTQPVLGVGLDGYQKLIPDYQERFYHPQTGELVSVETHPYPHNLFLAVWLELGLLGLIVFVWFLIKFFIQGFKQINKKEFIIYGSIMAAMVVVLIHGLVDTPYFKNDLSVLFWLIIGSMIILERCRSLAERTVLETR